MSNQNQKSSATAESVIRLTPRRNPRPHKTIMRDRLIELTAGDLLVIRISGHGRPADGVPEIIRHAHTKPGRLETSRVLFAA